ncbi:MAG: hypothetical protein R3C01_09865 [Planctomycetaceae bacterium]
MTIPEYSRSWVGPVAGIVVLLAVALGWMKLRPGQEDMTRYDVAHRLPEWSPDDMESNWESPEKMAVASPPTAGQENLSYGMTEHPTTSTSISAVAGQPSAVSLPIGRFTDVVPVFFEETPDATVGSNRGEAGVVSAHWTTVAGEHQPEILPVGHQSSLAGNFTQRQHEQGNRPGAPAWFLGTIETFGRER